MTIKVCDRCGLQNMSVWPTGHVVVRTTRTDLKIDDKIYPHGSDLCDKCLAYGEIVRWAQSDTRSSTEGE